MWRRSQRFFWSAVATSVWANGIQAHNPLEPSLAGRTDNCGAVAAPHTIAERLDTQEYGAKQNWSLWYRQSVGIKADKGWTRKELIARLCIYHIQKSQ